MRLTVEKKRPARTAMLSGCESRRRPRSEEGNPADLLEHMVCVRHIARQIHRKVPVHVELEDLVSAGALGLVDACRRFDRSRHVQFKSFAQFRIRGAILDWLRMADWSPRALRTKQRLVISAIDVLTRRLARPPVESEIAAELQMELADYQELARELNSLKIESLDARYTMDSGGEGVEFVAAAHGEDPLARLLEGETRQILADAME
ncbi:MAG TPA: sigma-70 family RNA polymerase sigma factor, partial [Acidobacteriaceae bacterium]|nr:sigma-70 family RNA polymerase sigma factor [Acidobacteriaceae bacterium]